MGRTRIRGGRRLNPIAISVLMPVYNSDRYLARAVESILGQTFGDFEFVVIDDGSTDRSREILEDYARRDLRIRLVRRPNTGYSRALNEALGLSRGEFLARMDSDDVAYPDRFARQIEFLRSRPDCLAVGCQVRQINPDGVPLRSSAHEVDHDAIVARLLTGAGAEIPHPGVIMRGEAVKDLGGYRVEFEPVEDLDLYLRLADRGRLANLPEVLLDYRQHFQSVNQTRNEQQVRLAGQVVAEALARRGQPIPEGFAIPVWSMPSKVWRYFTWIRPALVSGHPLLACRYAAYVALRGPFEARPWTLAHRALKTRLRNRGAT